MNRLMVREVHEGQILDVDELVPGLMVKQFTKQVGYTPTLLILDHPYLDDKHRWWVAVLHCELSAITTISLADNAVISYPDNSWHSSQYLVKVSISENVMVYVSVGYTDDHGEPRMSAGRGYNPSKRRDLIHLLTQSIDI